MTHLLAIAQNGRDSGIKQALGYFYGRENGIQMARACGAIGGSLVQHVARNLEMAGRGFQGIYQRQACSD
ncbi:hypothetical protein EGT33_28800 [Burkholderia multivorans]|nr:hypothetical protein EGT33_28800 [Burkholderia multivorans]